MIDLEIEHLEPCRILHISFVFSILSRNYSIYVQVIMQLDDKIRVYIKVLAPTTDGVTEELKQADDTVVTGNASSERYFVTILDRTKNQN